MKSPEMMPISETSNQGVAQQVARHVQRWLGLSLVRAVNSPEILLCRYAWALDGEDAAAKRAIEKVLEAAWRIAEPWGRAAEQLRSTVSATLDLWKTHLPPSST